MPLHGETKDVIASKNKLDLVVDALRGLRRGAIPRGVFAMLPTTSKRAGLAAVLLFVSPACSAAGENDGEQGAVSGLSSRVAGSAVSSAATVRVHYPVGYGHRISLRCGGGSDAWSTPRAATWTPGDIWTARVEVAAAGDWSCKPLVDDAVWALGANVAVLPGAAVDVWPHFYHSAGAVERIAGWHSNILDDDRGIWIYRPPSYAENPAQDYPVVYMQDGQNLFSDQASFGGVSWNVGGAMDDGIEDGTLPEAIVIGIENDANRTSEYTPVADPSDGGGGAAAYLAFVTQELKPQIDGALRTAPDAAHTAIIGSSLGALVSLFAGMSPEANAPSVFGLVAALSPSTWWDDEWIIAASEAARSLPQRLYLDSGDAGPDDDDVTLTRRLAAVWQTKQGATGGAPVALDYLVQAGATHDETYWRERLPGALAFLLAALPLHGAGSGVSS